MGLLAACYTGSPAPVGQTPFPPPSAPVRKIAAPTNPNRVRIDLADEASLVAAGFEHNAGGTSRFANGRLEITTNSYEEWMQDEGFVQQAANGPWAVEARFAITTPCARGGTGVWIHDGMYFVRAAITDHELVLDRQRVDIGPTSQLRTYRFELADKQVTVLVDGKQVLQKPASEIAASVTLMFGVLGDGCTANSSTWDYIAYETTPGPGAFWPPRWDWHAGTKAQPLIDALHKQLPSLAIPQLDDRDVPCLAIFTLDGALRDVLPLAYDAQSTPNVATEFRRLPVMTNTHALGDADRTIRTWTEPQGGPYPCDPAPGTRCPPPVQPKPAAPVPAAAAVLRTAVWNASRWSLHPDYAERSTAMAAKVYADAIAAKLSGATEAVKRLQAKLSSLANHPKKCGL